MMKFLAVSYQILILFKFIKNGTSTNCFRCDNEEKDLYEIRFDQIGIPNNELKPSNQCLFLRRKHFCFLCMKSLNK
uniref:Uncharacterized protein n=1 Tax=Globodera rostochiensis TaxID=31243 RepID=A0A914IEB6_GLORO